MDSSLESVRDVPRSVWTFVSVEVAILTCVDVHFCVSEKRAIKTAVLCVFFIHLSVVLKVLRFDDFVNPHRLNDLRRRYFCIKTISDGDLFVA